MTNGVYRGGQARIVGQGLCSCRATTILYPMFARKDLNFEWLEIAGVTPDLQGPQ